MKIEFLRFRCSHCKIEVLVAEGNDKTMIICKCGRWMGFDNKEKLNVKSFGKNSGDFALKVSGEESKK